MNNDIEKYIKLPIDEWPEFDFKWNTNIEECLKYNLDDDTETPENYLLIEVNFDELHARLPSHIQKYNKDNFWQSYVDERKISRIIHRQVNGELIAPPMLNILDTHPDIVVINDGNHRIGVCLMKNPKTIPIIIPKNKIQDFSRLFNN